MREPIIIGKSRTIQQMMELIKKAAATDSNILISGETGVGKELVASSIHYMSTRKSEPFIKLDCASLNENLIESELFGHKKGAFTGAFIDRPGLIESAGKGTFFFDEIGDISPHVQGKILSVVEDKELRRIGEDTSRRTEARFIFATNRDLHHQVKRGMFREDLYYRINILNIYIAPLRERTEDIPLLIDAFLKSESQKIGKRILISQQAFEKIKEHLFPGNIRELENILKRAVELSDSELIKPEDVVLDQLIHDLPRKKRTARYSMAHILDALIESHGNKSAAAAHLGISRVHLYRLLGGIGDKDNMPPRPD